MHTSLQKSTFAFRILLAFVVILSTRNIGIAQVQVPPGTLLVTRMPYLQSTTAHSVQILWNTNIASRAFIQYKLKDLTAPEEKFTNAATLVLTQPQKEHKNTLRHLKAGSIYDYRVGAEGKVLFTGQFQTGKNATQNYSFAVWGDSGTGSEGQKALAAQIDKNQPDFLLHTGDLVYPQGAAEDFDSKFFDIYQKVLSRVPFYGTLGNHDIATDNGQPFLDAFVLPENGPRDVAPERNYYIDYANARIAMIDSNQDEATLQHKIAPWLENVMSDTKATWKFVVIHHPAYSSGPHGDAIRIQKVLSPVFAKLHIDVVFAGHDHHYERFNPIDGVTYIITGAGGAGRYPRNIENPQTAFYWNDDWSFTQINVSQKAGKSTLLGKQISTSGAVVDQWELSK